MKCNIKESKEIGKQGPGQYVMEIKQKNGKVRRRCVTCMGTESKVDESQKDLTDISKLLEPAIAKGLLRHTVKYTDQYDDIPVLTYQDALETIAKANTMFEELPLQIQSRFNNNPEKFLEFVQNPANAAEMEKLGMLRGNDGLTATGAPSGAPTKTDKDGDGKLDKNPEGTVESG